MTQRADHGLMIALAAGAQTSPANEASPPEASGGLGKVKEGGARSQKALAETGMKPLERPNPRRALVLRCLFDSHLFEEQIGDQSPQP
jgi:hypothetical protein